MSIQEVKLPDIGEGVTEGEVVKWLVKVGDTVEADQPICELMTDKATVEVPTPFSGVVKELKANEGDIVPIETTLILLEADENSSHVSVSSQVTATPPTQASTAPPTAGITPTASSPMGMSQVSQEVPVSQAPGLYPPVALENVLATPSTRRLARELSVDINQILGTGLAGRVTRDDVLKSKTGQGVGATVAGSPTLPLAIPSSMSFPTAMAGGEERMPLRGIRRKIAKQMQMTKQVVPHFTIMDEVNVTDLVAMRTEAKKAGESRGVKVTYLPFIMKALIATLREFPMVNASIDDAAEEIVLKKYFNIGFAADTPQGLLVPVIKDADRKSILQLSAEIVDLSTRAREGKLKIEEMKGATITITNIGSVGGTYATPIINHPEVAIVGVYKMMDKPLWNGAEFVPVKMQNYTMTCDHRLIDGAVAANFLKAFLSRIESPSSLILDMC